MFKITPEPLPLSRASHYGDGVFETMRVNHAGQIVLLDAHLQRMCQGLQSLSLQPPEFDALHRSVRMLAKQHPAQGLKLLAVASDENLGYRRLSPRCDLRFHCFALPPAEQEIAPDGLRVALSAIRVSAQPALQGAKTLARLDQLLAANALAREQADADEAIMLSAEQSLCCAISANLFFYADDMWHTPEIVACGVRGVMRRTLIELFARHQMALNIGTFELADLLRAKELFLCNALRGIRPVGALVSTAHPLLFDSQGPNTQKLIEWVAALGFYA